MQRLRALPELWRSSSAPASALLRFPLCTLPFPQEETHPGLQNLVVTASGPDRPGIVARLSKRVLDCGGNVEISRMSRLAGEFSVLMLISFDITKMHLNPLTLLFLVQSLFNRIVSKTWAGLHRTERKAEQLRNSLLQIEGLQVNTRWISDECLKNKRPLNKFRKILLRGVDNPGLVYNLTEYLSSHGINIESLETYTQEAPSGSGALFMMEGVITMPVGLSTATFIHNLDTLQATLGAEITISDLPNPANQFKPSPTGIQVSS